MINESRRRLLPYIVNHIQKDGYSILLSRTFSRSIDAIYLSMEAINHATH
jgi:hypothetical protein